MTTSSLDSRTMVEFMEAPNLAPRSGAIDRITNECTAMVLKLPNAMITAERPAADNFRVDW